MNAEEREVWAEFVEAVASGPGERITEKRAKAILVVDAFLADYEMGVTLAKHSRHVADLEAALESQDQAREDAVLRFLGAVRRAEAAEERVAEAELQVREEGMLSANRLALASSQYQQIDKLEARAEAAEAALAERDEPCSLGCYSHVSHPCERCGRIAGCLPAVYAAAQELSALRAVAEAVKSDTLTAKHLRSWADILNRESGYCKDSMLCVWLRRVATALAALDAARGREKEDSDE